MPELPEVEVIKRSMAKTLTGQRIIKAERRRKDMRYPLAEGLEKLAGDRFSTFARRGKYLFCGFRKQKRRLVFHLGMSGRLRITATDLSRNRRGELPHDHVVFTTDKYRLAFFDPRRFGSLRWEDDPSLRASVNRLGAEPSALRAKTLRARFATKKASIKAALLDQSVIAGLGNIYACEALFAAAINPQRSAASIGEGEIARLIRAIRRILRRAVADGGSTIKDHLQPMGEAGYFQTRFAVYGRKYLPCRRCKSRIMRIVQTGRATFYCPKCQSP